MLVLTVVAFSVAWWLGLYLLARDPSAPTMRRAGLGLLAYALALALSPFDDAVAQAAAYVLAGLPALIWTGVLIAQLPLEHPWRAGAERVWRLAVVPLGTADLVVAAVVGGWWEPATAVLVLAPLLAALVLVLRERRGGGIRDGVVILVSLLFGLGIALLLMPLVFLPQGVVLAAIGMDLAVLGVVVAASIALESGEALAGDLRRSAVGAGFVALVFGGQVGLVSLGSGETEMLWPLAFGVVAAAIAVVTLATPLQTALDSLVFTGAAELRAQRSDLREVADALSRRDEHHRLAELEDDDFTRLVRQALRHYGDLGKLVASPLIALPAIDKRLLGRDRGDHFIGTCDRTQGAPAREHRTAQATRSGLRDE